MTILQPPRPDAKSRRNPLYIGRVLVEPPILQAPMAGFTDHAFRQVMRRAGGVGLPATEMVSARGLLEMDARSEGVPQRLWGVKEEPRPLAVQIWNNDAGILAAVGARLAEEFHPAAPAKIVAASLVKMLAIRSLSTPKNQLRRRQSHKTEEAGRHRH